MIGFNLSIDFEGAWGDLQRVTFDPGFERRVAAGLELTPRVIELLARYGMPSTWGVVGAMCCESLEQVRESAPQSYDCLLPRLQKFTVNRPGYPGLLFCRDLVQSIAATRVIELGSHGFVHVIPTEAALPVLQEDVTASTSVLRRLAGRDIQSFIPPQNYHWPDAAFAGSGIRFIRHTPTVLGCSYSDPTRRARLARLWNDFIRPAEHPDGTGQGARILFLRIDRGERVWRAQMGLFRRLLTRGAGKLYCFSHPHNLDTPETLPRLAQFCELVLECQQRGTLNHCGFSRHVPATRSSAMSA